MSRRLCAAFTLALALAGLAPPASFGDLTLSVAEYDSRAASDGSEFDVDGISKTIKLTLGKSKNIVLDDSISFQLAKKLDKNPTESDGTGMTMTLNGDTESFSDAYSFSEKGGKVKFLGGTPIVFHLGAYDVTVTPIASTDFRKASFLETLAPVPTPEPSSLWIAAVGGAGFAVYGWRRSRRAR